MLMKLGVMIFRYNDNPSSTHSRNLSFNSDSISTKSDGSHLYNENAEGKWSDFTFEQIVQSFH